MKLIIVTPAGRERYLRLLAHYVLGSAAVEEWHLWDNCRTDSDRRYLRRLAASDPRISIKELPGADGGFGIIGDFYKFCDEADAIYLRFDDDVVFIQPGFFEQFKARALEAQGQALWFAPLIINNAICSSLIQNLSRVVVKGPITAQAMCPFSWAHPAFPKAMHPVLIEAVRRGRLEDFHVPDRDVRMARFSINALAFFGADIQRLGDMFLPVGRHEEEWFSAVLPAKLNSCGRVFGNLVVSHFSFYTQEHRMLQTDILDQYYHLAGLPVPAYEKPVDRKRLKDRLRPWKKPKGSQEPVYEISLRELPAQ